MGQIDNRGSHFYLALYWAQAAAAQDQDPKLREVFTRIAEQLASNESRIVDELNAAQGKPQDLGGYYAPDPQLADRAMRPSATFNKIIDSVA